MALVWANSPWSAAYEDLWHTELTIDLGGRVISEDLLHWINDGLMTLFFFVIGLEIKDELTTGQLNSVRRAAVPVAGAVGGMVVPAVLYLAFNAGGDGSAGWGIPMATDVAFALGVLALLGRRVPAELKVLLLGLAIADDIGAIVVIAAFYSTGIEGTWLAAAGAGLLLMVVLQKAGVRYVPVYVVLGSGIWLATFESGVHATIAGVALGLLAPSKAFLPEPDADRIAGELSADRHVTAGEVRAISLGLREAVPVTQRLQDLLHPYTSYVIVPLFALANAGVAVSGDSLADAASVARDHRDRGGPGGGQAGRRGRRNPAGHQHRLRAPSARRAPAPRGGHGRPGRDRLHRVHLRGRVGLRRPRDHRPGQDRGPGGLGPGRGRGQRHPAAGEDGVPNDGGR